MSGELLFSIRNNSANSDIKGYLKKLLVFFGRYLNQIKQIQRD